MRKVLFCVPQEVMPEFSSELSQIDLRNTVKGVTQKEEIVIEVTYQKEDAEVIDDLEERLAELKESLEEESEEDDQ